MKTLKESILSSTNTGKTAFLIPETKEELMQIIKKEIWEKGWKCDLNHIKTYKITDMSGLFYFSHFNGDISKWDVSNVTDMKDMFKYSQFNRDISNWKINLKCDTRNMFNNSCIKNKNKPKKNGKTIK